MGRREDNKEGKADREDRVLMIPIEKIFSDRLRAAREVRGLTQAELGKLSGLQPSAISHFETEFP